MTTKTTTGRKTKAVLCAGAAFALLLGGGSTYAAWSDNDTLTPAPADISTGSWSFTLDSTTEWFDVSPETDGPVAIDPTTFPLVPGDKIQAVTTVSMSLDDVEGTYLDATVSAVSVKTDAEASVSWLTADAAVVDDTIVVTIEFPYENSAYATQSSQPVEVDLGSLTVTVTQVRPALDGA